MKNNRILSRLSYYGVLLLCCALLVGVSYPLIYDQLWNMETDFYQHAMDADLILIDDFENWYPIIGHPLWHLCTVLMYELDFGSDHAGAIVTVVMKLAQMLIISWFFDRQLRDKISRIWAPVLALITVLVSAICIPSINPQVYVNAGSPNVWHSPTQTMVLFWMILSVSFLSSSYDRQLQIENGKCDFNLLRMLGFSVMLILSTLAKPVFVQAFFPGAAVFFLFQWIRHPKHTRYYIQLLCSLIPVIAVILFQMTAYYGEQSETGMLFFINIDQILYTLRMALMLCAFPIFVMIFNRKNRKGTFHVLSIFTFAAACLECAFIRETGLRSTHGNFDWAVMANSLLMWVSAMPQFVDLLREKRSAKSIVVNTAGILLLSWHLISGVYYLYLLYTAGIWF